MQSKISTYISKIEKEEPTSTGRNLQTPEHTTPSLYQVVRSTH